MRFFMENSIEGKSNS